MSGAAGGVGYEFAPEDDVEDGVDGEDGEDGVDGEKEQKKEDKDKTPEDEDDAQKAENGEQTPQHDPNRPKEAYDEDSPEDVGGKKGGASSSSISYDPTKRDSMQHALDNMVKQLRNVREQGMKLDAEIQAMRERYQMGGAGVGK